MKGLFRLVLVGVVSAFFSVAYANLTIHITQGVDKPYPIAVVPFSSQYFGEAGLPDGLAGVISTDLKHSGRFALMPTKKMPAQPHHLSDFKWSQWRHVNANLEYVLLGQVTPAGGNTYNVQFRLVSMVGGSPLVGQRFSHIPASRLRALAHHISDIVFRTITGIPGDFATRIAYVTVQHAVSAKPVYQLVVSDADGHHPQVLLQQVGNPIASPVWSPNGRQLAYVSYVNNRMAIYAITLATGKRHLIANFRGMNSAPSWSPDGKKMAMALSMGGGDNTNIYVMDLASKKLTRYTTYGNNTSPVWSPDGKTLAFNSNRGGNPQIYTLSLATRQVSRVTYNGLQNFNPVYTPNGKYLVIMHQQNRGGPIRIAKVDLASDNIQTLTTGELDRSPSVSPNGQMVIYANYDKADGILAETSINGTIHLTLPATQGTVQSPAWSPWLT